MIPFGKYGGMIVFAAAALTLGLTVYGFMKKSA
ncbi:hypothetical protein AMPC_07180 [Anaeromyxobacter paludicola]|uniref:Hmc operon protein 4 n=1 Tax=Anaeromyxobacter paludicola TaxID=2918171 RepID=A0ABN6N6J3_9BACT|nr:hypothetical protein AMPC_07180 [Anaeromyxobacter paludicola]